MRNLAAALFLTERDAELDDNQPKVKGRIITTSKRPRKCGRWWSAASRSPAAAWPPATQPGPTPRAPRNSEAWRAWREGDGWRQWNKAIAPVVNARRRVFALLRDKHAVRILFNEIAPRFADRDGGYTRILRLAKPRLGDAGTRAILEFVGVRDRIARTSEAPSFESEPAAKGEAAAT